MIQRETKLKRRSDSNRHFGFDSGSVDFEIGILDVDVADDDGDGGLDENERGNEDESSCFDDNGDDFGVVVDVVDDEIGRESETVVVVDGTIDLSL